MTEELPTEEQVKAWLTHHQKQLEEITKGKACSLSMSADNFSGGPTRPVEFRAYITGGDAMWAFQTMAGALIEASRAFHGPTLLDQAAELRKRADELERRAAV